MPVVNPTMKMDWIEKYWTAEEAANAEEWVLESVSLHQLNFWPGVLTRVNLQMVEYRRGDRSKTCRSLRRAVSMPDATSSDAARASRAQFQGFQTLQKLSTAV